MALQKNVNGAWVDVENLKRYENGAWVDCESAKRYVDGAWTEIWGSAWEFDYISELQFSPNIKETELLNCHMKGHIDVNCDAMCGGGWLALTAYGDFGESVEVSCDYMNYIHYSSSSSDKYVSCGYMMMYADWDGSSYNRCLFDDTETSTCVLDDEGEPEYGHIEASTTWSGGINSITIFFYVKSFSSSNYDFANLTLSNLKINGKYCDFSAVDDMYIAE